MSPGSYYQQDVPTSPHADSDSDLDLDIQELNQGISSKSQNWRAESHIPLRNLRMGSYRGVGRRNGASRNSDLNEEDLHSLLRDEPEVGDTNRYNLESAEENSHLFVRNGFRSRRNTLAKLRTHLRIPSLKSITGSSTAIEDSGLGTKEDGHDISQSRLVYAGIPQAIRYPPNSVSNAKYTPFSFLPKTLYNEFSFFFNMYFLLVALSQAIPSLRIGYLSTYIAPLAFVMTITLGKEAFDDIERRKRDREANSEGFTVLRFEKPGDYSSEGYKMKKMLKSRSKLKRNGKAFIPKENLPDILEENEDIGENGGHRKPTSNVREVVCKSRDLKVGDVLKLSKDQRVPADVVILKSSLNEHTSISTGYSELTSQALLVDPISDSSRNKDIEDINNRNEDDHNDQRKIKLDTTDIGETFIRTDQLDGETDWKLRLGPPLSQSLEPSEFVRLQIMAGKPDKNVNNFAGTIQLLPEGRPGYDSFDPKKSSTHTLFERDESATSSNRAPLSIDNTAWCNTVLASNSIIFAVIIYTGPQTRSALSTSSSRSKTGLLEYEINSLTKILCALTFTLSIILVILEGIEHDMEGVKWYVKIMRFLVLFSTIVPIGLRVNLDMGKSVYSWFIQKDSDIEGAVVRTSTIPEDLGRIEYILSDKTGTLTQNEMEMKKIHVGTVSYANEAMDEITSYIKQGFSVQSNQPYKLITPSSTFSTSTNNATRSRRNIGSRVRDVVLALALCHNVIPTVEDRNGSLFTSYQASSPDEIAIVQWTQMVGLQLIHRDRKSMTLQSVESMQPIVRVRILDIFPFTSNSKRMGIIVQFFENVELLASNIDQGEIWFYQKGADSVMSSIVAANDWLDEEAANMAREGLRTLVIGRKYISSQNYQEFAKNYREASLSITNRESSMSHVIEHFLEHDLELLGITGVEDKLQKDVKPSLELLRNAGIKIWMLTGDKVETARCVAVSSKLVARGQHIYTIDKLSSKDKAQDHLEALTSKLDAALLIDGDSLSLLLKYFYTDFISLAVLLPAVIACRCSPTQKADIAILIREYTKKRVCCIGDGGNDVSMIQAADVGVGIVGKEGRQASLAADFSIVQFCHLTKLLVWHGRNSYKRSAKLAQFVIHRGLIISICQAMYSIAIKFEPEGLYKDWLLVGYATVYTMAPVFSLVLDKDVDENLANLYPELYKELTTGASLSYNTFFVWVLVSIYQGSMIQGLSQILTQVDGPKMVSISFTVLILNELCMVAFEVTTWHPIMIMCLVGTALIFLGSIPLLGGYFDLTFIPTWDFVWRVLVISAISLIPPYVGKQIWVSLKPPSYKKVRGI
ncbi:putative phospholipid-transporting ATPase NEO1 [Erysiphe neolycopersici]|uniref:Phospholipid-transporting ATPase n=1 Tax=Erysiphe neolycopersici TaxID=212602 RepID=A0A420I3F1_9PEZI|nr:putative phospholipid-transporting ATPase NEO1 [Erysiphe neolycopersici]